MPPPSRRSKYQSARAAVSALLATAPLVTRWIERLLAQLEPRLTLSQYQALLAIADESLSAADLAQRTGVSGPAVSQLLAGLVAAGWADRRPSSRDRRRQELLLTSDGEALLSAVDVALTGRLVELIGDTPDPELRALAVALPFVHSALAGTPPPRRIAPGRPPSQRPHPQPGPQHPPGPVTVGPDPPNIPADGRAAGPLQ